MAGTDAGYAELACDEVAASQTPSASGSRRSGRPPATARRSCLGQPRLRKEWEDIESECILGAHATVWETLWVVIFTMAVANMRNQELLRCHDIEWYALHFLVFYGVSFASIRYATRFNDEDAFHTLFWVAFLFGIFAQVTFLNNSLPGFAGSTACIYGLIAVADLRVAVLLPRARVFCLFSAASCSISCALFTHLATLPVPSHGTREERSLLWLSAAVTPLSMLGFNLLTDVADRVLEWDVPMSIEHFIGRFQGLHMMIIVCSFLFPIALQGAKFAASWHAKAVILLANLYAVFLKLAIFDTAPFDHANRGEAVRLHAIRRGRYTKLAFIISFPLSILGIAMAGVAFLAGLQHPLHPGVVRSMACYGSTLCWATLTLHKALHLPVSARVHWSKVVAISICSISFMLPLPLQLAPLPTLSFVTALTGIILALELALEGLLGGELKRWRWQPPRLLKDWEDIDQGHLIGANVSSHEHMFTVLVAVAVFQLTELLQRTHNLRQYTFQYLVFYAALSLSFTYACRFNDDDAAHKILWSIYEFLLLLMLEGAGNATATRPWSLLKTSTTAMFALLAVAFFGRVALHIRRARVFALYFATVSLLLAALFLALCFSEGLSLSLLLAFALVFALSDAFFVFVFVPCVPGGERLDVPMNIEYIVHRFDGLFVEVLGVAVIVPNAFYPGNYDHFWYVLVGDLMAASMAALLKIGLFDVEPMTFERHAIRRCKPAAVAFMANNAVTNLAICAIGAGMSMLIPAMGAKGATSYSHFPQQVLCGASFILWASLTVTKLLHRPVRLAAYSIKVLVQSLGAAGMLAPLVISYQASTSRATALVDDTSVFALVVCLHACIVIAQLITNAYYHSSRS